PDLPARRTLTCKGKPPLYRRRPKATGKPHPPVLYSQPSKKVLPGSARNHAAAWRKLNGKQTSFHTRRAVLATARARRRNVEMCCPRNGVHDNGSPPCPCQPDTGLDRPWIPSPSSPGAAPLSSGVTRKIFVQRRAGT